MNQSRNVIRYINAAHVIDHMFMLIFPAAVLGMTQVFALDYAAMIGLSLGGFIAFGACSLPAGWLGDRWSRRQMMLLFFFGIGASAIFTGLSSTPAMLVLGLTLVGVFAAIYHPVGTAMLVAYAQNRGREIGINGMWGNLGVALPTLALTCSVLRTHPMDGPTEIAVGAPDFSFRKHKDGGFIITQRGKLDAYLTLDHLLLAKQYMPQFRAQRSVLNVSLGKYFFNDLALARRWSADSISPFERVRVQDPAANPRLNNDAMNNLKAAWPVFEQARIAQAWAGTIDVTPDSNPVIGPVAQIPGLTVATGFSGHGFGTSPAAGHLAADIVSGHTPIIDPSPYRFDRF